LENCIRASQPLLIALRITDGDETPAAPKIMTAVGKARDTIQEALKGKPRLLKEVLARFDKRWDQQMKKSLYGATLFLNSGKFFSIREEDKKQARILRSMFNDVMWKLISDEEEQTKISNQVDDYDRSEGEAFSKPRAVRDKEKKNPSKCSTSNWFCLLMCFLLESRLEGGK
jgi:hypothetical protein